MDDGEKKLPTSEELPTSADNDGGKQEEKPETVIVDYNGWIEVHHRLPDGTLDKGHDFTDAELVPEEAQEEGDEFSDDEFGVEWYPDAADEDSQRAERIKTIDIETLLAAQDILEANNRPISQEADLNIAEIEKPRQHSKSGNFELHFYKSDLDDYTAQRKIGLSSKSIDWIARASLAFWESTKGEISHRTVTVLRERVLAKYASPYSHSKVLSFAKGFLTFLAKTKVESRYTSFEAYLDMPRAVKERKSVTNRIVTKDDIQNVLRHIKRAEDSGNTSAHRAAQYSAFVIFGAFTGQRSEATMAKLTVGQFKEALRSEKPVLQVEPSQDKIRMSHFVPLHTRVVKALEPLLVGRNDDELMFTHSSFLQWTKRQKIPMTRFKGHFVFGDLRKFTEQHGDVIQWDQSNRAYILTHGVSGVDWKHYKHPLPEHVYNVYMKYWRDVELGA